MEVNTKTGHPLPEGDGVENAQSGDTAMKKAEALARQINGQRMAQAMALKMNAALLEVLDEAQQQEAAKADRGDETGEPPDSARFSGEGLAYNRSGEEAMAREELELLLGELWRLLESWQPHAAWELTKEMDGLEEIYQKLLQAIMRSCSGEEQAGIQADRLNDLLLSIIDRLGKNKFPSLLSLLEKYGDQGTADVLRASVLHKVMGRPVSPQEVTAARARAGQPGRKDGPLPGAKAGGRAREAGQEEGILYSRAKGNRVDRNQQYKAHVDAVERFRFPIPWDKGAKPGAVLANYQGQVYSVTDIERTEQFLRYIMEKGNLYEHPGLTAKNEELLGFLMADGMAKVQMYTEYAGIGGKIAYDVRNALERFFRYFLGRETGDVPFDGYKAGRFRRPDPRIIQRIYYQVMELIQHGKTPGKGLEKGLQYVLQVFLSKKDKEQDGRRGRETGFFSKVPDEKDKANELKYGAGILDKDWKEFLKSIGQEGNPDLQAMLLNCPWGMVSGPGEDGKEPDNGSGSAARLFLIVAGVCVIVILAAILSKG